MYGEHALLGKQPLAVKVENKVAAKKTWKSDEKTNVSVQNKDWSADPLKVETVLPARFQKFV